MAQCTNNNPLLSVVIPMYNCAPVITRCLDSIDYPDCEILVINDGSKDNSAEVVTQYAATHPNVRLVNKENGGASSARNLGIQEAKGKYIAFIDADDFWFPNGIARIVELAEKEDADIVKYIIRHVENGQPLPQMDLANCEMHAEIIEGRGKALERCDISDYHVVDAVFKRSVIIDNNIRFQTDLHLHEDDVFMGMFYCHAMKVVSTDMPLYCYIHSSDFSSTHRQSIERQRILINSGYLAAQHRSKYVQAHYPEAMPIERLKYMRWVKQPKDAIVAQLSLKEYRAVLNEFRKIGVWPLQYKYINVSYWWAPLKYKMKLAIKVWLINHPRIAYAIYGGKNERVKE
jgi:glycosyltransferase involved in cell wall biosynthesis